MRNVLIVEDEDVIRQGLKKILEELIGGYRLSGEARDGGEALNLLESSEPDIVLTDIRMTGMDGLDLIKQIRRVKPKLPIIVISGYADFEYARQALKYNVTDYLLKPVDRQELAHVLDRLFGAIVPGPIKETHYIVRKVRELVSENPGGDFSLKVLSDLLSVNPQYLSRVFKIQSGANLSDFVTQARIEKAVHLLQTTNLKVYEVALLCGYSGVKHFNNIFKNRIGRTPSEVRGA
jgi:YesN/AraC family two-component response regulator